jgi:hypothetical protein
VGEIREKSDTFSFGVVLLELITGKKPIVTCPVFSEESIAFDTLANWVSSCLPNHLMFSQNYWNNITCILRFSDETVACRSITKWHYNSLVGSRLCGIYNYDEMIRMIACEASCVRESHRIGL